MNEIILRAKGLAVGYGSRTVLEGIDFGLERSSLAVLLGANGSGKSTLMRTIAGEAKALKGTVELADKPVAIYSRRALARTLSVVLPWRGGGGDLTVRECVVMGRYAYNGVWAHSSKTDSDIVEAAIRDVGLAGMESRRLGTLSDGERQKAMIARALAQQTPVMLLDEPTAYLDVAGRIEIVELLRSLADDGRTILMTTHDTGTAIAAADTLLVVDKQRKSVSAGMKDDVIASGVLDRAFAGLIFDSAKGDFTAACRSSAAD